MFIGKVENDYSFARMPGRSDSKPRPKRSILGTGAKIAGAGAGLVAVARAGKAGLAQKGLNTALKGSKLGKREALDSVRQGAVNAIRSDAGKAAKVTSAVARKGVGAAGSTVNKTKTFVGNKVASAKNKFGTAMANRQKKKTQTMKIANQMRGM